MKKLLLFFLLLSVSLKTFSQETDLDFSVVQDILEQIAESKEEEIDFSLLQDDLQTFYQHPINLNKTTKEELERLHFLSDIQIENLLYYLYRYAPMHTLYELQLVEGFDEVTIKNLLPFVVLKNVLDKSSFDFLPLLKKGKQELYFQNRYTFQRKEGYKKENGYIGEPFYQSIKYRFHSNNQLMFGFTFEKDEGEPLLKKENKGFDFYSAHFQANNLASFKRIVVGDFRAAFGYGLVLNNHFGIGKSSYVLNVLPSASGLNKTSSTNEYNFLRGVGATVKAGKFEISGFYSRKNMDGSLTDSATFSSLKTDGYHRTIIERENKNTVLQQALGTNISYSQLHFKTGFTLVKTIFDKKWNPVFKPYNLYYFRGQEQLCASVDYQYRWQRMRFYGETAMDANASMATLNALVLNPSSRIGLVLVQRAYSKSYQAFFSNSFGDGSTINNEQGVYIGTEFRPISHWKISAYADSFRFPWLKYGVDKPSEGHDFLFQADYAPRRNISMYWRYKNKQKEKNFSIPESVTNAVEEYDYFSLTYVLKYDIGSFLKFQNRIDINENRNHQQTASDGFLIAQDVSLISNSLPLRVDFRYAFFDAENYENRIYTYEKDVLYAFSIPMYYGRGSRFYVNVSYMPTKHLSFWCKFSYTKYVNKESIGSALETINGNEKTDVKLMMRYRF